MYSHLDEVEMSARYREDHHLMQWDIDNLESRFPSLKNFNNSIYRYLDYSDISGHSIRGIYLSNYIPWNQKLQQEFMHAKFSYKVATSSDLFNPYEHPHCSFYNGVHDWLKYLKHGYGRFLDHLVREVRWRRISTANAFTLIKNLECNPPVDNIKLFREFMDISPNSFQHILNSAASPDHFATGRPDEIKSDVYHAISESLSFFNSETQDCRDSLRKSFSRIESMNSTNKSHIFLNGYPY